MYEVFAWPSWWTKEVPSANSLFMVVLIPEIGTVFIVPFNYL